MEHIDSGEEKRKTKNIILIKVVVSLFVVCALLVALSYAWFKNETNIATLVKVANPTNIAILGPHGEAMESIDLNYTDDEKQGNKVTIKRVISVSTDEAHHQLEIAHTTNLSNLSFKLYKAAEVSDESGTVNDGGYSYSYNADGALNGTYINEKSSEHTDSASHKYANDAKHSVNFVSGETVQAHAEPLYWNTADNLVSEKRDPGNTSVDTTYLTYYVLEITWEENTKETDMFYIFAKNK